MVPREIVTTLATCQLWFIPIAPRRNIKETNMDHEEAPKGSERSIYLRLLISVAWFVVIYVIARIATGAIIGTFTGASTTDLAVAHAAGRAASDAFFARYWLLFFIGTASFTGALYWRGVLPGTGRFK
jgi:hypothetical protein